MPTVMSERDDRVSLAIAEEALSDLREAGNLPEIAAAQHWVGWGNVRLGRFAEAQSGFEQAAEMAR